MAKSIEASVEDVKANRSLTEAMGLIDLDVVKQEWNGEREQLFLHCIPRWGVDICPQCGQLTDKVHDYPERRQVHDAPLRGVKTFLVFDVHRLKCRVCHHVFTLRLRDVVDDCTYTRQLGTLIADPSRKQDVATLSRQYQIGYKVVESILLKAAEGKVAERERQPLLIKQLGIDEQSNRKGQGNYILVLTDLERRIVLDILPDRQKETLINWLQTPPKGIDLSSLVSVATDLWCHYRDSVVVVFGDNVHVVADRFHVMQNLHEAIHQARRQAQKQAKSDAEKKQLKGLRYLLLKKDAKLTEKEKQRLQALKDSHPQLYAITRLRQRLYEWYEAKLSRQEAIEHLTKWLEDAAKLENEALDTFCQTLQNWQSEIVNFFLTVSPAAL